MRRKHITSPGPDRASILVTLGIVGVAAGLTAGCGEPPPPTMPPATQEQPPRQAEPQPDAMEWDAPAEPATPPAEPEPIAPPAEAEPVQPTPPPPGEF